MYNEEIRRPRGGAKEKGVMNLLKEASGNTYEVKKVGKRKTENAIDMDDSLEERELIVKITSEKDQRIKYIDITEKGTEFFHKLVHHTSRAFF